ncbi:MAG: hypothetical protein R2751_06280 [Bacteroidales bacterium]
MHLNIWETLAKVFLITILPAFTGIRLREWKPEWALKLQRPLRYVLPLLLLAIYAGVIFIDQGAASATRRDFLQLFPYTLVLNVVAMLAGLFVARIFRLAVMNQFTISIEVGLQNSALAIMVAANLLNSQPMALVPVVYGSFSFFSTLGFGWLVQQLGWHPPRNGD